MLKRRSLDSNRAIVGKPGRDTTYSDTGSVQYGTPHLLQYATPPKQTEWKKTTPSQEHKEFEEAASPEPDEYADLPEYSTDDDIFALDPSSDEGDAVDEGDATADDPEQDYEFTQPPLPPVAPPNSLKSTSWNEETNYEETNYGFTQRLIQTSHSAESLRQSRKKDDSFSRKDLKGNIRSTDPQIFENDGSLYEPFFSASTGSEEELTCAGEALPDTDVANGDLPFNWAFDA